MDFLPVFLDIKNKMCLVVGGGEVATRKVQLLLQAGAQVSVVSPELNFELNEYRMLGKIQHLATNFQADQLRNPALVIAATDDRDTNRQVSAAAQQRQIPVNVVDNPDLCTFIMPSIVDRSPLLIAISSGGQSPVLARLLRAQLETMIPAAYGRLAAIAGKFRERVKQHFTHPEKRRIFWEKTLQGRFAAMVLAGKDKAAQDYLLQSLQQEKDESPQGEVYLVGAGPGNPDLLTFRAMRLMQQADAVVYDRLVSPAILDMVRRDATRIYAGKERNRHTLAQESINQLLVRLAQEGKRVLRLKGGDPFIFGRGGEEIETLAAHHIPFQVVPGITAASGVAAYAGIPLTHRDYAQSCIFVTGHLKNNSIDLDWLHLARPHQTIVIYMGLLGLSVLCQQLIAHGLPDSTPAAIIQQGTMQKQKIVTGTLQTLPGLAEAAHLTPPTLIIVGEVVKLHRNLAWFEPALDSENAQANIMTLEPETKQPLE
ncbi:MAG: uroporphyrinogen-III C-methyltransferase [Gammaproteobacteria bacterium]|nr:MAG: uroporphyrinogen-III C-methyltransferase [Gammaproteobacteria bacterium]